MTALTKALNKLQEQQATGDTLATRDKQQETGTSNRRQVDPSAVFAINFLRRDIVPVHVRRVFVSLALAYLTANALFLFYLFGIAASSRLELSKLQSGLKANIPSVSALAELRGKMAIAGEQAAKELNELNQVIALEREEFPFGGKLGALTKTLPARTWMTGLSGDREGRRLTVQATYLVNPENPYDHPTKKWVEALKADPAFGRRLKSCDVGASSQKIQGKVELFSFELVSEWEK